MAPSYAWPLAALGIPHDVTKGVPSFAAGATVLGCELTLPEIAQTVILTRAASRSSPMPKGEELERLAASAATLAIHLGRQPSSMSSRTLSPFCGESLSGGRLSRQLARRALNPPHPR